jgi:hypothetical protein
VTVIVSVSRACSLVCDRLNVADVPAPTQSRTGGAGGAGTVITLA